MSDTGKEAHSLIEEMAEKARKHRFHRLDLGGHCFVARLTRTQKVLFYINGNQCNRLNTSRFLAGELEKLRASAA